MPGNGSRFANRSRARLACALVALVALAACARDASVPGHRADWSDAVPLLDYAATGDDPTSAEDLVVPEPDPAEPDPAPTDQAESADAAPDLALVDLTLPDVAGCPPAPDGTAGPLHALFIGNSYTYVNDLPGTFSHLATAGGRQVSVDSLANGGWTLYEFSTDAATASKLAQGGWDVLVLQEQSQVPTIPSAFEYGTIPGAKALVAMARAASPCVRTVLFETWGRQDGGQQCGGSDCSAAFADFDAMQDSLSASYQTLAGVIGAAVAPVGEAWRIVRHEHPEIGLFGGDGSHPSMEGTYLAACVFYGRILAASPIGLPADGGATSTDVLQAAAVAALGK